MKKSLLVVSYTHTATDPRLLRQIETFAPSWNLTVAGSGEKPPGDFHFVSLVDKTRSTGYKVKEASLLSLRRFEQVYWMQPCANDALKKLQGKIFDLILANDVETLPLARRLADQINCPIMLDAHEFAPRQWDDQFLWRTFRKPQVEYLCRQYLPGVTRCTTVSPSFIDEYHQHYGVKPTIVVNAPKRSDIQPMLHVGGPIRMIHHGSAVKSRRLDKMITAFRQTPGDFQLDMMLVGQARPYYKELQEAARGDERIRFVEPAPTTEIVNRIQQYDVGIYLLDPANYNQLHALPNKLFEFIQARLALVISPNPAMARVVNEFQCGVVAEDYSVDAFARAMAGLTRERVNAYKQQSHVAAGELCAEKANCYWVEAAEACITKT